MNLKEYLLPSALGLAATAAAAIGTTAFSTKVEVARHDERITRLEDLGEDIKGLRSDLKDTQVELVRVQATLPKETPDARK